MAKITVENIFNRTIKKCNDIPNGSYHIKVRSIKESPSKFEGFYATIGLEIQEGTYKSYGFNMVTASTHADGRIGSKLQKLILSCVDIAQIEGVFDTQDLVGMECVVKVVGEYGNHSRKYSIVDSWPLDKTEACNELQSEQDGQI